jgi:hypothetical protein
VFVAEKEVIKKKSDDSNTEKIKGFFIMIFLLQAKLVSHININDTTPHMVYLLLNDITTAAPDLLHH